MNLLLSKKTKTNKKVRQLLLLLNANNGEKHFLGPECMAPYSLDLQLAQ